MNDFRPETFSQFSRKTKLPWDLKLVCIFILIVLIATFFGTCCDDLRGFWGLLFFFIIVHTIQSRVGYWVMYHIYNLGREAFEQLNKNDLQIIPDIKVYIKGFDLFAQKRSYRITFRIPMYDFNQADLILTEDSLILLGKPEQLFGSTTFTAPVEITKLNPKTTIAHAKLIDWKDKGDTLQIEIKDDYYNDPFKIEFKSNYEEIKSWLVKHYPK